MKYSNVLLICCVLFLTGCCLRNCPQNDPIANTALTAELTGKYGKIEGQFETGYLNYLFNRISKSSYISEMESPDLALLHTSKPLAFAIGTDYIVISRGLVLALENEAELAFVLSHELAHQFLKHALQKSVENSVDTSKPPLSSHRRALEIEADRLAIKIVASAGYDPNFAVYALAKSYRAASIFSSQPNHPDLRERIDTIKKQVIELGWQPPGTVNRRDFNKLIKLLQKA